MTWNGESVKSLRLRMGWSQSDLARRLNCDSNIVVNWENGKEVPAGVLAEELDIFLKQADSSADEVSNYALAEFFLEESELQQCELKTVEERFVDTGKS